MGLIAPESHGRLYQNRSLICENLFSLRPTLRLHCCQQSEWHMFYQIPVASILFIAQHQFAAMRFYVLKNSFLTDDIVVPRCEGTFERHLMMPVISFRGRPQCSGMGAGLRDDRT